MIREPIILRPLCELLIYWNTFAWGQRFSQQIPLGDVATDLFQPPRLNFSSPAPHIFSSAHGLARQGHNTFFSHGFSVAACEIAAYTPLYHGWLNLEPPKSPEWLAFTAYVLIILGL